MPTGGRVVGGQATINQSGSAMQIQQASNRAALDWQSFSIGAGASVVFNQPSASAIALNRVLGSDPSAIFGRLSANGQVFLLNPNGILFAPGAQVDVGGLLASTLGMQVDDFMAGRYVLRGDGATGSILNQGSLRALPKGYVALIAPSVANEGSIETPRGTTALVGASAATMSFLADGLVQIRVDEGALDAQIANQGAIRADGGAVLLTARALDGLGRAVVNNTGVIEARTVENVNGTVRLSGGEVKNSGEIRAEGPGGKIAIEATGGVQVTGVLEANGAAGSGGDINIQALWVALGGNVSADGASGGGTITVQAGWLSLADRVSALGGSGAGGAIRFEVAGKSMQNLSSLVDASGASGGTIRHVAGQQITSSGTYLANGSSGLGGRIDLSAPATKLLSAKLHADGAAGGGQVRVGGEYQGGKNLAADELPNAELLAISAGSVITANATQSGPGGTVITWANLQTAMFGDVSARPADGGAGGFIEISSGDKLTYGGMASAGLGGTVLFDPKNIVIASATGASQYAIVLGYNYVDVARLKGNDLEAGDGFGYSVSLAGTQLAVGAPPDAGAGNATTNAGAVYLFNNPFTAPALAGVIGKGYTGSGNFNVSALGAGDFFGASVSLAGTQLAVGAPGDDGAGNTTFGAGAVYLFNNPFTAAALAGVIGKGYTGTGNFNVSALAANDEFGTSVSLFGTQLAVGAYRDDGANNATSDVGAVYLINNPFGTPTQAGIIGKDYTTASGPSSFNVAALAANDGFGTSVSLSGTQLAVGAIGDNGASNATPGAGAVYLFNNPFTAPALAGVIGKGYTGSGNFDVSALTAGDNFGMSVSLSGTQLAVGAHGDDGATNATTDAGAVYLFNNPFTTPALAGIIGKGYTGSGNFDVSALEASDLFGYSVSLSGTQLAVGAAYDDGANNATTDAGAVYLFNNPFTAPALAGVIGKGYSSTGNFDVSALETNDRFGTSVSLAGTQLAVGAYGDAGAGNTTTGAGAVYLINNPFSTPALAGVIGKGYTGTGNFNVTALEANDFFGYSVSLSGTQLAVGAPGDAGAGNATAIAGAVYLFNNPFTAPALAGVIGKDYTTASGPSSFNVTALAVLDQFGTSVSLSGTQLAVGAPGDAGAGNATANAGAVYLFNNSFTAPVLAGVIGKGYTGSGNFDVSALEANDIFGYSVSLSGTWLAVGAIFDDGVGNATADAGAVYLFNNPFTAPALAGVIGKGYTGSGNLDVSALEANDRFGTSISLAGTQLAVGAYGDAGAGNTTGNAGAVYLINNPFSTPALAGVIGKGYTGTGNFDVSALEANDFFGYSVSLSGTQLAVGAIGDDGAGNATTDAGAVYLFNNPFTAPALAGVIGKGYTGAGNLDVSALAANDNFGTSVSLSGTQLAVGAPYDDGAGNSASDAGAVYLFNNPFTAPALAGVIGKGYTGAGNLDVSALAAGDGFGYSVSLAGTQLAVGAPLDDGAGNSTADAGAVYLFNNPFTAPALAGVIGKGYTGAGNLDVSALEASDYFGYSVSLSGTQLAVGAPGDAGAGNGTINAGAVYLVNNPFTAPALAGVIGKGYTGAGNLDVSALAVGDLFGQSVSLSGAQLAVGALGDDGAANSTADAGAVYLFNNPFSAPTLAGVIGKGYTGAGNLDVSALAAGDYFGYSVSLSGSQLAVGAPLDDGAGNGTNDAGAVYLFNNPFTAPALAGVIGKGYTGAGNLDVSALAAGDLFGVSVSLSGTQLAVGAPSDDGAGNSTTNAGAVYGFTLGGGGDPVASATFGNNPGADSTITPAAITAITNTGSAVVLQANNDITLAAASPITTSAGGAGGAITMQAGRSVLLNSSITTDNGNLTITANDPGAQTGNRDANPGGITMAPGTTLNAGTGTVALTVGAGVPGAASGNLVVENISAANVNLQQIGGTNGSSILRASGSSLITATNLLMEVDHTGTGTGGSVGTAAAPMRVAVTNLESHTHETSPGIFIDSPTQGLTIGGVPFFLGSVKGVQNVTSGDISVTANGNLTTLAGSALCGATGGTGGPICTGGNITLAASGAASDVTVSAGITGTGAAGNTLTVRADHTVKLNGATVGAANAMNVVLNADRDSDGLGNVQIVASTINTVGGKLEAAGGSAVDVSGFLTGRASGDINIANAADQIGVYVSSSTLNSGGGAIRLLGQGATGTPIANRGVGVWISSGSTVGSGSGTILIDGLARATGGTGSIGVNILDIDATGVIGTTASVISARTGGTAISVVGQGPLAGSAANSVGVTLQRGTTLSATGAGGAISITGTGGVGAFDNNDGVVTFSNTSTPARVSTASGALTITGTKGGGANAQAVRMITGGQFGSGTQTGNITITGLVGGVTMADTIRTTGDVSVAAPGTITQGAALTVGGNTTFQATGATSDINVTGSYTGTGAAGRTLTVQAGNSILFNSSADVSTTNPLNVVLNSDRDASGAGQIRLNSGTAINSNGGDITLGGGTNPLTMPAVGFGPANVDRDGIELVSATLNSAGGTINLRGSGGAAPLGAFGVRGYGSSVIDSGAGAINIVGTGGVNGGGQNIGVYFSDPGTQISSTTGNIAISGTGAGTADNNYGIYLFGGAQVNSTSGTVTLAGTGASGTISNVGVLISGAGSTVTANTVTATAPSGAVSLGAGSSITATGGGNALQLAGASFVNSAGAGALSAPAGRWLVWSDNPAADTTGGLAFDFKQYNASFGVTAPALTMGNGLLYTLAPTVTVSLTGTVLRPYDATTTAPLTGANLASSALQPGDAATLGFGAAAYDTMDVGTGKTVNASGLTLAATSSGKPVFGYSLTGTTAAGPIGQLSARPISVRATDIAQAAGNAIPTMDAFTLSAGSAAGTDSLGSTVTVTTTATTASPAGIYPLTPSSASFTSGSATNYAVSYVEGTLTLVAPPPAPALPPPSPPEQTQAQAESPSFTAAINTATTTASTASATNPVTPPVDAIGAGSVASVGMLSVPQEALRIPDFGALLAAADERRESKRSFLAKAVQLLEQDPSIADLPSCAGPAGGDCIAVRDPSTPDRDAAGAPAPTLVHLPAIGRKVALLIGVGDYAEPIPKLDSPVKDVEEIGRIYRELLGYEVRILANADKATIIRELNRLILETGSRDSVTVMYAGHGHVVERTQQGYWIPARASADDPRQWISNNDIARALQNIAARQVLLVSDSCYSGTLARESRIDRAEVLPDPGAVLAKRSVTVLTSGGEEPVPDQGKDGHSVFAWHFMRQLRAVSNVTFGVSVHERVAERVQADIPQQPQYGAGLASGHERGADYLFEVRRYE